MINLYSFETILKVQVPQFSTTLKMFTKVFFPLALAYYQYLNQWTVTTAKHFVQVTGA